MPRPLISIITPTWGRAGFHETIAHCVATQDYGAVEWLVMDDSETPSPVLSAMPVDKVRYIHTPHRLTIGEKRNRLIDMARGELIAHFDDDDYYAPDYLSGMADAMEADGADFVRLTGFFVAHVDEGQIGYYRTLVKQGPGFEFSRQGITAVTLDGLNMPHIHLAYGWTYLYRKSVWRANPYKSINTFEDREFVRASAAQFKTKVFEDHKLRSMHSVHSLSSSRCFPQFRIPPFMVKALAPDAIHHLARLRKVVGAADREAAPAPAAEVRPSLAVRATPTIAEASYRVVRPDDFRAAGPARAIDPRTVAADLFPYCLDIPERRRIYVSGLGVDALAREPFIYMRQRAEARDLVSVPWEAGPLFAGEATAEPVFVFSPGRCGSTLLHALLGSAGAVSLSEADVYTQAVVAAGSKEVQPAQRAAIASAVALVTRDLMGSVRARKAAPVFIKLRSLCCANPPLVLGGLGPRPRTVFLIRPLAPWLRSMSRAFGFPAAVMVRTLEQALAGLGWLVEHTDCTILRYDELSGPPEPIAELLRRHFGLRPALAAVEAALAADAQEGTPLARTRLGANAVDMAAVAEAEAAWRARPPAPLLARLGLDRYLAGAA